MKGNDRLYNLRQIPKKQHLKKIKGVLRFHINIRTVRREMTDCVILFIRGSLERERKQKRSELSSLFSWRRDINSK